MEKSNKYWQSLEEWRNDPKFKELVNSEFMTSPLAGDGEVTEEEGPARRHFLKLMGASMALTTFGCVRRPAQKIVPYANRPHEIVPGVANYYASSFVDGVEGFGTVVTTREGRPIKLEGNKSHPANFGGMSARAHSHVLSLYDPDRANGPKNNLLNEQRTNKDTVNTTWKSADAAISKQLAKGGVAVLTGSVSSPTTKALLNTFKTAFSADHYAWDSIGLGHVSQAQKLCYGQSVVPAYRLDKAKYIVSVDADLLGSYLNPTRQSKGFAQGRKKLNDDMNKLVVFETLMTLTGTNADERFVIHPGEQASLVLALTHEVVSELGFSGGFEGVTSFTASHHEKMKPRFAKALNAIAKELISYRGDALVAAGSPQSQDENAIPLQIAVNLLNTILGNDGKTVDHSNSYSFITGSDAQMYNLIEKMKSGSVKTLVIQGVNPAYAWGDSFAEAAKNVEMVVYVGDRNDETGSISHYLLTESHALESWGDAEVIKGVYSIQQPTIRPLYDTRSFNETLLAWLNKGSEGDDKTAHDYVKSYWSSKIKGPSWNNVLQNGVFTEANLPSGGQRSFNRTALNYLKKLTPVSGLTLNMYSTVGLRDGSLANVSWLQEFPDPVTKICWDNYATVSPKYAAENSLKEGDVVKLTSGKNSLTVPVHIQPGQSDKAVGLALGYGRWAAGEVANKVGVRSIVFAKDFKNTMGHNRVLASLPVKLEKTGKSIPLANVQGHHSMEGRQIVVETTLKDFQKNPESGIHRHKIFSLWSKHKYTGHKWALSVDLNSCTGCGSCIIACQSENNIPTVGKKYVLNGREMHWMRVDRYYVGDPENPSAVHQPLMCFHCDNAPCETVCPVLATVHSDEGTNDMIYNRCVGTRYCANNCPYKVRRFNWFSYTSVKTPLHMAMNPEVTVRSRGVMEKCTFCNHRIKEVQNKQRVAKTKYKDGDILTACQQSCPTDALVFGDMNDPNSQVSKDFADKRTYILLEELNNTPSVRYKTKIRNVASLKKDKHHGGGH